MASATLKLFIILIAIVTTVNTSDPIEKLQNLKEKSTAAIAQMKYKINAYKENTKAKIQKMKSYLNNLKLAIFGKSVPFLEKPALTYGYSGAAHQLPAYAAVKPIFTGYDHKLPGHYHDQPYSYVQFQSGPGYYKSGILH